MTDADFDSMSDGLKSLDDAELTELLKLLLAPEFAARQPASTPPSTPQA